MAKLLHISASPRGARSASLAVTEHFLATYREQNPSDLIETLDLWKVELPEFNGDTIDAKYAVMHGETQTPEQTQAWQAVVKIAEHFKSADKYVFSLPMWNFGVPYRLKHFIDVLVQPGLVVAFVPGEGFKGMVTGKPVLGIYSRGSTYGPGSGSEALNHQSTYLTQILSFIGFTDIKDVLVEPTMASPTSKDESIATANKQVEEIARTF